MCVLSQPLVGWIHSKSKTPSGIPRDSPNSCFVGGVKFLRALVVVVRGGGRWFTVKKKKNPLKRRHISVWLGFLVFCYKLIHLSGKRSLLKSKMPAKFRGPKPGRCLKCMKPFNIRHLFHYDWLIHSAGYWGILHIPQSVDFIFVWDNIIQFTQTPFLL